MPTLSHIFLQPMWCSGALLNNVTPEGHRFHKECLEVTLDTGFQLLFQSCAPTKRRRYEIQEYLGLSVVSLTSNMDGIISQFTTLQKTGKYKEAHSLLCDAIQNKGIEDAELQWRLALIYRDLALSEGKKDRAVYKKYVNEGLKAAEHGLKLDPDHPKCHSWYAIFLNYVSQLEGVNKRIENSFKMKEHWMKAITADPDDAVTLHALGRWCYEVADLPWIKRKFAEAFFSSPPTSSYEEALKYLLDSETKSPKLIAENSLYLARTYHRLKRKDEAKKYCQRVLEFTADDLETEEAKKEVTALLKNL